jgi:hypothetical protein
MTQDISAELGMTIHHCQFVLVKAVAFQEDPVTHTDLADVVEQACDKEAFCIGDVFVAGKDPGGDATGETVLPERLHVDQFGGNILFSLFAGLDKDSFNLHCPDVVNMVMGQYDPSDIPWRKTGLSDLLNHGAGAVHEQQIAPALTRRETLSLSRPGIKAAVPKAMTLMDTVCLLRPGERREAPDTLLICPDPLLS